MSHLKPGDLAIITKSVDGFSVGKIVQCEQIAGVHSKHGTMWAVTTAGADIVTELGVRTNRFHHPQDWLKKIPSDPLPEDELVTDKELENCH